MRSPSTQPIATELELARLLASTADRRARDAERVGRLARRADGRVLSHVAGVQRMGPLLASRFLTAAPGADAGWTEWWRAAGVEQNLKLALRHRAAWTRIADALETAGIPALPLKGAVLAEQLYGDEVMRDYADVDVLVPHDRIDAAVTALRALDYVPRESHGEQSTLHVGLDHAGAVLPPLDLHWRVHWFEDAFSADLLERSRIEGGQRRADDLDQLVALLLFYARDGFRGLRLAADVAACWDLVSSRVGTRALAPVLRRYPELARALTAAALVAEEVVGLPGRRLLDIDGRVERRVAIATRLTDWQLGGERDQAAADVSLVDGLCAPAGELWAFARRYLIHDADRISSSYGIPAGASGRRRLWQVLHPFNLAARYALAFSAVGLGRGVYCIQADARESGVAPVPE